MWGGMKIWKCDTVDYCTTGISQTRSGAQNALQTLRVITSVLSYFLHATLHILKHKLQYILPEKQLQHIDIGILSREDFRETLLVRYVKRGVISSQLRKPDCKSIQFLRQIEHNSMKKHLIE